MIPDIFRTPDTPCTNDLLLAAYSSDIPRCATLSPFRALLFLYRFECNQGEQCQLRKKTISHDVVDGDDQS
jgi:hypothetical protein